MTRSNRGWNRLLLLVLALGWLAAGGVLIARQVWDGADEAVTVLHSLPATVSDWLTTTGAPLGVPAVDLPAGTLWTIGLVGAAVVAAIVAIAHVATRGRGRTSDALAAQDVIVDVAAVEDAYTAALGQHPDIVHTSLTSWQHRGAPAWRAAITVRHHARLDQVAEAAERAAHATRERIGTDTPIVVHLTGGLRAAVAHNARVS